MKANIETVEPVIRPAAVQSAPRLVRSTLRTAFVPVRTTGTLFHAWRA